MEEAYIAFDSDSFSSGRRRRQKRGSNHSHSSSYLNSISLNSEESEESEFLYELGSFNGKIDDNDIAGYLNGVTTKPSCLIQEDLYEQMYDSILEIRLIDYRKIADKDDVEGNYLRAELSLHMDIDRIKGISSNELEPYFKDSKRIDQKACIAEPSSNYNPIPVQTTTRYEPLNPSISQQSQQVSSLSRPTTTQWNQSPIIQNNTAFFGNIALAQNDTLKTDNRAGLESTQVGFYKKQEGIAFGAGAGSFQGNSQIQNDGLTSFTIANPNFQNNESMINNQTGFFNLTGLGTNQHSSHGIDYGVGLLGGKCSATASPPASFFDSQRQNISGVGSYGMHQNAPPSTSQFGFFNRVSDQNMKVSNSSNSQGHYEKPHLETQLAFPNHGKGEIERQQQESRDLEILERYEAPTNLTTFPFPISMPTAVDFRSDMRRIKNFLTDTPKLVYLNEQIEKDLLKTEYMIRVQENTPMVQKIEQPQFPSSLKEQPNTFYRSRKCIEKVLRKRYNFTKKARETSVLQCPITRIQQRYKP